ncbi:translocation/assembly module TamB domain-containing protein [uncultured Spirosoma sp.]|uniref:translocation/assembly module TamB domain-containing protein n=1 Tax=uncultured Spirosoma sp. TaxID=278208 RepID=UPI002584407C|nr:translocation/assembly module TamB domain-containing protein [uncultured Spirosoma sp.]
MRQFFAILAKTLLYLVLAVVGVAFALLLAVQLPVVQTRIVQEVARRVSEKLEFPVSIDGVSIKWFDSLTLSGVTILDREQRPMIQVGRLDLDYNLRNLIDSSAHNLHLDGAVLYQPAVRMIKNPRTGDTNLDEFIAQIDKLTADTTRPSVPDQHTPFTIAKIQLIDGAYTLDDPREPYMRDRNSFDYNHFTLKNLTGNVSQFLILGDTIALNIKNLSGVDKGSGLRIRRLDTRFLYSAKTMDFDRLYAHIGNSIIRHSLTFFYERPSAFGDFNSRVLIQARFHDSEIRSKDLGFFSDYLRGLNETWYLSGLFTGTVNEFRLQRTDLRFGPGGRSRLAGDLTWKGLPDIDRTTVNLAFAPSVVNMADIRQYYPDEGFNRTIQKLGTVAFNTRFVGSFSDFKNTGTFRTAIGTVTGDVALKLPKNSDLTTYVANLKASDLNLGVLIDDPEQFGLLDGQAQLSGRGTSLDKASVDVNGQLARFGWQGYNYRDVTVRGNLQKAFFHGQLSLRDPNLAFDLDGEFDFTQPLNRYDMRGTVQQADLRALGFVSDSLQVSTSLDVQLTGNKLDNVVGQAYFRDTRLTLNRRTLRIDTLSLVSSVEQRHQRGHPDSVSTQRYFGLDSEFMTARLQGDFQPQRTIDDLTQLAREYRLFFAGDAAGMNAYYARKKQRLPRTGLAQYSIDYQTISKDIAPLVAFLSPTTHVAPATRLEGRFTVGNTSLLTATVHTDSLRFGTIGFGPTDLDLTTSKFTLTPQVLASAVLSSKWQTFSKALPTSNLQAEGFWDTDHIDFTTSIDQAGSSNRAALNGELRFKGDAIDLTFRQSQLRVLDGDWTLNPESLIRKVGDEYTIRNLSVANQDQRIQAAGRLSADSSEVLNVAATSFRLQSLNSVLNTKLGGTLNGTASVRNIYKTPILESQFGVTALSYDSTLFGDLRSQAEWDQALQQLNVDARLRRSGSDVLTILGNYTPTQTTDPLDLTATVTNADLAILDSFTKGLFSNLGGTAVGQIAIKGRPVAPVLQGELSLQNGRGRFDYLKTDFTFDDKVYFGENEIITRRLTLRDPDGNTALLRGGVYHDGFRDVNLRFDADFRNFRIMNTTVSDNDVFYGQGVISGKAELTGPLDNLAVRANVASNKGTRIYIPLDGAASVSSDDQIRFVSHATPKPGADLPPDERPGSIDLSRITMDFNFNITPDAYCEIQLDKQTGDIIKAYGQGLIAMRVDTKGDFSMTGNYAIQKGDYTFTFQNVINKRFQIRPNSRITWTGDPYGALLDVTAAYTQYTSLSPLLPTGSRGADQTRRYPVDLVIKINGDLGSPAITYNVDVKDYPSTSDFRQAVTAFQSRLQSNDQELTRQVSSILLFNQLLPEGTSLFDQGQVNAGVANSVSELVSNQISRLASSLNDNLDIGLSFGGFTGNTLTQNENLLNNLQLRFSYRLLNDRLRISRDGGFTYGQNQYNTASLLGEWTLEYWLTSDGRLRAKVYNRNQQSILNQINITSATISTGGGLSLLYTRSFNKLFSTKRPTPGLAPDPVDASPAGPSVPVTPVSTVFW